MRGGYTNARHNQVRDITAIMMKNSGCGDVKIEPTLLPLTGEELKKNSNTKEMARLDVSGRNFWSKGDKIFADIRIFNSLAPTNQINTIEKTAEIHEVQKKRAYGERILNVERATFTPLVFSTIGTFGPEAERFYKRLAGLYSVRSKQSYHDAIRYIRLRLSFCILKSVLVQIRGYRGSLPFYPDLIDMNLVPLFLL